MGLIFHQHLLVYISFKDIEVMHSACCLLISFCAFSHFISRDFPPFTSAKFLLFPFFVCDGEVKVSMRYPGQWEYFREQELWNMGQLYLRQWFICSGWHGVHEPGLGKDDESSFLVQQQQSGGQTEWACNMSFSWQQFHH